MEANSLEIWSSERNSGFGLMAMKNVSAQHLKGKVSVEVRGAGDPDPEYAGLF
ncbi:MAG: hypothetical protein ACLU4N_12805 [Butyricimonas faecihominis]